MVAYLEIILTSMLTGAATGFSVALVNYFTNKLILQNFEKLIEAVKKNGKEQVASL